MVDALILGALWVLALSLLVSVLAATGRLDIGQLQAADPVTFATTDQGQALGLIAGGVLYALSGFYHVYAWARLRASPGQQLLHIEVLDEQAGRNLSVGQAAWRWFVRDMPLVGLLLVALMLLWYGAVVVSIQRDPRRRGVHDYAARSVVVRRSDGVSTRREADP